MNSRSAAQQRLAVIGDPITHSRSPALQNFLIAHFELPFVYEAVHLTPPELASFIARMRAGEFAGANVTLPHKQTIVSWLDDLAPSAGRIGAVNTIVNERGLLIGHNSDAFGFSRSVQAAGMALQNREVLVLGAGGAAAAVVHALRDAGATAIHVCNRDPGRARKLCDTIAVDEKGRPRLLKWEDREAWLQMRPVSMIVNATSAGMPPQQNVSPLPPSVFYAGLIVIDLIYHPHETLLLREARAAGARTLNGLPMLIYQGVAALEWWSRQKLDISKVYPKIAQLLLEQQAISGGFGREAQNAPSDESFARS